MKRLSFVALSMLFVLSACVFYPVQTDEQVNARHTAQAETLLPTVTQAPAEATATEVVVEPTAIAIATEEAPQQDCRIAGNIGSDGSLIYHLPTGQYYSRVHIDLNRHNANGVHEQYFCDEQSAIDAGFRAALR